MAYNDIESVEEAVAKTAPNAEEMAAISSALGGLDHVVWFDPDTGQVLHTWRDLDDSSVWHLDVLRAGDAEERLGEQLVLVLDRLRQPMLYRDCPPGQEDKDLKVLEEFQTIQLAALREKAGGDPVMVNRLIQNRITQHQAEIALLAVLRGRNLINEYGTDRGAAAHAGRVLGVGRESARRALAAPKEFAERVRRDARDARSV